MPKIVKITLQDTEHPSLQEAAEIMLGGGLVVFPTETVYGLGTWAFNETGIQRIFTTKKRDESIALPVQIADITALGQVCSGVPQEARVLAKQFWPGPLTIVLQKNPNIPDIVTGGLPTVGVRIPDHPIALSLLRKMGDPIVATSANISASSPPVTAQEAAEQLGESVDMVLDSGACAVGTSSTVVSIVNNDVQILRQGSISEREIFEALKSSKT